MRLLLDTHALLWWLAGSKELSTSARQAIENPANEVLVSAASAFEIATKDRLGKLPGAAAIAADISGAIADQGFVELPIRLRDGERAGGLAGIHRDPFDRMLIAQAIGNNLVLVSKETLFDHYGVRRFW